jgi:hypothetical protein
MKAHSRLIRSGVLTLAVASFAASAADLQLGYADLDWTSFGDNLKGTIRIEVRNLTRSDIRNVDVGIAHPGVDAIESSPLQFGTIPAGEVRAAVSGFVFSTRAESPLVWRVQYEQDGVRKEIRVLGESQEGQRP